MSAKTTVDVLKSVLGTHVDVIEPEISNDTSELGKYFESQENQHGHLLEHLRSEATNDNQADLSCVDALSPEQLFFLTGKFEEFQGEIKSYKDKLAPIEMVLENFSKELNELSSNLVSLHQQSDKLTSSLERQKRSTEKLNPIILDLIIPPDIAKSIISSKINDKWLENLRFINEKTQLINNVKEGKLESRLKVLYTDSVAFKQLQEGIDLLTAKAVERVRDHIITQIKLLRSSTTKSSQSIQKDLIRVKEIFVFLKSYQPNLANQLQLAYLYTMKWYYRSRFSKYLYALQKLSLRHVDSTMLLGSEFTGGATVEERAGYIAGSLKGWLYSGNSNTMHQSSGMNPQSKVNFSEYLSSIDKRLEILQFENGVPKSAMPAQIAESTPFGYWIEFVFNQWYTALIDNVMVEYLFIIEFFYQGEEKFHTVEIKNEQTNQTEQKDWASLIFEGVYAIGREFVVWLITHMPSIFLAANRASTALNTTRVTHTFQGSCDAYAILLMIRIIQTSQIQLHNEFHIPVLEDHLNSLLLVLWPQFTRIIDHNCDSMKKVVMRVGSKGNLAPTALTQQFGQLLLGLLKLSIIDIDGTNKIETLRGEPLYTSITRLRNDFENVITKLSNQIKNPSEKETFLFNNYFLVVTILTNENKNDTNTFITEQIDHFEKLCNAYKNT